MAPCPSTVRLLHGPSSVRRRGLNMCRGKALPVSSDAMLRGFQEKLRIHKKSRLSRMQTCECVIVVIQLQTVVVEVVVVGTAHSNPTVKTT